MIKHRKVTETLDADEMNEIYAVSTCNKELQIQVKNDWDDWYFDLSRKNAIEFRDVLTEFIGDGKDVEATS